MIVLCFYMTYINNDRTLNDLTILFIIYIVVKYILTSVLSCVK